MKAPATQQKLRGGYYTPQGIAKFLADWAVRSPTDTILEPSCGDGALVEATVNILFSRGASPTQIANGVEAVELDVLEAKKTVERFSGSSQPQIHNGDFFEFCEKALWDGKKFDAVIGNPPFIRFQHFQESHRVRAFKIMRLAGLNPNRLTNSWVPFVVASTLLLQENGGRLAMVIPAELLQVGYASELRQFLSDRYDKLTIVTFDKLVFEGIQQEVVLLLGERHPHSKTGVRTVELADVKELMLYQYQFGSDELKEMDHSREKWIQYFLDRDELELLRKLRHHPGLTIAHEVLDVDVGIVTGLNEFFVLTQAEADSKGFLEYTQPIVTRSGHLKGIIFAEPDFLSNTVNDYPTRLIMAPNQPLEKLPHELKEYVLFGEQNKYHEGYKCRIRKHWYVVPSVWRPDGFMLRQVHLFPKIMGTIYICDPFTSYPGLPMPEIGTC